MLRPLPTPWNLYNLTASPFFQETLEALETSSRPLRLFVGRRTELQRLWSVVHGAGDRSSRQAVAGPPGIGKTTLVQELKSRLLADGYLTTDAIVPVLGDDTTESLFGRVLGAMYETILVSRPSTVHSQAMRDAQVMVRTTRLSSGGGNLSLFGMGAGFSTGTTVSSPGDIMIDGPRIMRDLMDLVRSSDARGVLLHLNNLENLSESQASRAAEIFRSLRDPMLMHDRLHFVVVGTTEAVNTVVNGHAQVRSTFGTLVLEPLDAPEVHEMLHERYAFLKMKDDREIVPPVEAAAVEALYALFRGDLRGLLKALDEGVTPLLGLAGTDPAGTAAVRPLTLDELRPALQRWYAAHLASIPEQARVQQLTRWGSTDPASVHTQKSLKTLWRLSQPAVSNALADLVRLGYVVTLPRISGGPTQYVLSGTARLIFG